MKLISLNIEGNRHLDRVLPFILREMPDVLCLMEVQEPDVHRFTELGYETFFKPMMIRTVSGEPVKEGLLYCTKKETVAVESRRTYYLVDESGAIQNYDESLEHLGVNSVCVFGDLRFEGRSYTVGTIHFTWTPQGTSPSPMQYRSMDRLLGFLTREKPHVMCGDFNIPRRKSPLYETLTEHYTDTIPPTYASSLDPTLHKLAGRKDREEVITSFMVDYVFTQPPYLAEDVHLEFGLSDHAGVVATVRKT